MDAFVKDGVLLKELKLLTGLMRTERATHLELARFAGMSPAMVNNYMVRFRDRGYVRRVGASNRASFYELTEEGANYRERLLVDYNAELIRLYKTARHEIASRIEVLLGREPLRICLCPAGDTAEVVLSVTSEFPNIFVVAVLDDSPDKQCSGFMGYRVAPFEELPSIRSDGVLVATISFGDLIEKRVKEVAGGSVRVWRLF
ncbi:MAG TPA: winged helix-turn-helix transcriptional regulator [Firmicutes bacterium]|nr:winged helix-turn-helix transcriptional regulator [Bacillota bacterium]